MFSRHKEILEVSGPKDNFADVLRLFKQFNPLARKEGDKIRVTFYGYDQRGVVIFDPEDQTLSISGRKKTESTREEEPSLVELERIPVSHIKIDNVEFVDRREKAVMGVIKGTNIAIGVTTSGLVVARPNETK